MVAFNALGTPLFLWSFGARNVGSLRVVEFFGNKHANFNMALWRREAAAKRAMKQTPALWALVCAVRRLRPRLFAKP